jgi:hypothetical protein
MILGKFVFDHRPPLACAPKEIMPMIPTGWLRFAPSAIDAKTPRDIKDIARAKRLAFNQQDFVERIRDKVPGRPVPSKSQWRKLVHSIEKPLGRRS